MSHINKTLRELELTLKTAQEGQAYYEAKVVQITQAMEALRALQAGAPAAAKATKAKTTKATKVAKAAKPAPKAAAAKPAKAKKAAAKKPAKASRKSVDVPSVGRDVVLALLDSTPKTRDALTEQLVQQLQVETTPQKLSVLRNRLTATLANMVEAKAVTVQGEGRSATFQQAA